MDYRLLAHIPWTFDGDIPLSGKHIDIVGNG